MPTFDLHFRQSEAFQSKATELLYGGAGGGGKSHFLRVFANAICSDIAKLQVYLFRRTYKELQDDHVNGPTGFLEMLAPWIANGRVVWNKADYDLTFWNGSQIHLRHCQREDDRFKYRGEMHVLLIDEVTTFTDPIVRYLRSRVRMSDAIEVPERWQGKFPCALYASNPGGVGHNFVKTMFIDEHAPYELWKAPPSEGGMLRQFIPARLEDNPSLSTEEYEAKLEGLGDPALARAMRWGDWDIVAGGMFDDLWRRKFHVLPKFSEWEIPDKWSWHIDRSYDYGSSKPWACVWFAESDGTAVKIAGVERFFPRGTVIGFGEWYGWNGKPNQGGLMTAKDQAAAIRDHERFYPFKVNDGPADPAIYAKGKDGRSIADDMASNGITWKPGDNTRIPGWEHIRARLKAVKDAAELGRPMEEPGLLFTEDCVHVIRTLPALPRLERKRDDIDTDAEDHPADLVRYRLMTKRYSASVSAAGWR